MSLPPDRPARCLLTPRCLPVHHSDPLQCLADHDVREEHPRGSQQIHDGACKRNPTHSLTGSLTEDLLETGSDEKDQR